MQRAFALAMALATLTSSPPAKAESGFEPISSHFMRFGAEQEAPRGFTAMCATDRDLCNREDVAVETATPLITLPALDLNQLRSINRRVNAHVRQVSDESAFGEGELWRPSGQGPGAVGDCEDLALQKMVELRAAGYPASSLLLAVAYRRRIGLHTVLVVRTQSGDYVLDNMSWTVKPWAKVKYSWLSVQSPADPSRWHRLS